ncbi:MAG: sigma-70 family RNA polymerase sigma factor [Ktedonobacteraceae bacterium]|nr:sigma-70 family RNA polymerase sigma factor [Ktedonobacteraceae bacterium]
MDGYEIITQLYQQHAHALFKYIYSSLAWREEAEDILVEVFLAALRYQSLTRMNEQQQFSWLIAVTRNKLADWHRRNSRLSLTSLEQILPFMEQKFTEPDEPEIMMLKQEEYTQLQLRLSQLPETQQEVLRLRFIMELRYAEIGKLLGKSEGAIQSIFWRAIHSLRSLYQQEARSKRTYE